MLPAPTRQGPPRIGQTVSFKPSLPLARDVARSLVGAGFTLHHCAQSHPLCRLRGVCLLPVARRHDPNGKGGVAVSWTTHDLLSLDWDRWSEYHSTQEIMNGALAGVLDALGYERCRSARAARGS